MGVDRPMDEYPLVKKELNPFKIKLSSLFTIQDSKVEPSKDEAIIDKSKSYFITPNVFIQPLIYDKEIRDTAAEALFSNDGLETKPLQLMTDYVTQVVRQIEFDHFPITKGQMSSDIDKVLKHSRDHEIPVENKAKPKKDNKYASGVIHVETRPTSFDHCSLRGGEEFIRIKDKDLAIATHPDFQDEIVYVPLTDPNIGCFIFKMNDKVKNGNMKEFSEFARNIIDNLEISEKQINNLYLPCFNLKTFN